MTPDPPQPNPAPAFNINIEYGTFTFVFSVDPLRQMSHILVTCLTKEGAQSTLVNRMVERSAATRGIDFHLAGIEVFAQQAVKDILSSLGELEVDIDVRK